MSSSNKAHKNRDEGPVLAVDLGGTKLLAALVDRSGRIVVKEYRPTLADEGQQAVIGRINSAIDHILSQGGVKLSQLHSISLAAAGGIDSRLGLITLSPHLPGWHDVPLREIIRDKYDIDTFVVNDANAAALGEHRFGAGKGVSDLLYVTVSTGIGGGIIIGGKLYEGASGSAGEVGHMTIDVDGPRCACGNNGCLEMFASGSAVAREAVRRIRQGKKSSLEGMVKGKLEDITAELVDRAAGMGDSLASDVISQAARYLGIGMASLVNILNPELLVFGGGMSRMGDRLFEPVRQEIRSRAFPISARAVRVVPTQLGSDAGVIGAAVFAWGGGE